MKQRIEIVFGFKNGKNYGADIEAIGKEFRIEELVREYFSKDAEEYTKVDNMNLLYRIGKLMPEVKKDIYGYPMADVAICVNCFGGAFSVSFDVQPR